MSMERTKNNNQKLYTPSALEAHRDDILKGLDWMHPKKGMTIADKDISVTFNKSKEGRVSLCVIFRHGIDELIDPEKIGRISFCKYMNNCILFSADKDGYKLFQNSKAKKNKYLKMTVYDGAFKEYIGDYDLKYDEFLRLYYIEREG